MAEVRLEFIPPTEDAIAELNIYEAPTVDGPFTLIDTTSEIGTFPGYITEFITQEAVNTNDWFAIAWVDENGSESYLSQAVQGGSKTFLGEIVERVMIREPSFNEAVVAQEAQVVMENILDTADVPIDYETSFRKLSGIVNLTIARVYQLLWLRKSQTTSYTAGLISEKVSDTRNAQDAIQNLIDLAARDLGMRTTVVAQMADVSIAAGVSQLVSSDLSRLLIAVE